MLSNARRVAISEKYDYLMGAPISARALALKDGDQETYRQMSKFIRMYVRAMWKEIVDAGGSVLDLWSISGKAGIDDYDVSMVIKEINSGTI